MRLVSGREYLSLLEIVILFVLNVSRTWVGAVFVLLAGIIQDFQSWFRYFVDKLHSGSPSKIKKAYHSWLAVVLRIINAIKEFIREFRGWWKNPAQTPVQIHPPEPSSTISL